MEGSDIDMAEINKRSNSNDAGDDNATKRTKVNNVVSSKRSQLYIIMMLLDINCTGAPLPPTVFLSTMHAYQPLPPIILPHQSCLHDACNPLFYCITFVGTNGT